MSINFKTIAPTMVRAHDAIHQLARSIRPLELSSSRGQLRFSACRICNLLPTALAGKGSPDLIEHALILARITRRKMEGLEPAHPRSARDLTCGSGRQMCASLRERCVRFGKCSFYEQQVGIRDKPENGLPIGRRIRNIGHIADLFTRRNAHDMA